MFSMRDFMQLLNKQGCLSTCMNKAEGEKSNDPSILSETYASKMPGSIVGYLNS